MAGWSNVDVNSCLQPCDEKLKSLDLKLQSSFLELVSGYLKGCSGSSNDCFRPLPPRLGNGDCIDLLKLYFAVKQNGGFEAISEKNLWGEVSLQCGFDSGFGSAFKLIYAKYLSSLENCMVELGTLGSNLLMELEQDYRAYVSNKFMDVERGSDDSCGFKLEKSGLSFIDLTDPDNESEKLDWKKVVIDFVDSEGSNEGNDASAKLGKRKFSMQSAVDDDDDCVIIVEGSVDESLKQVKSEMSSIGRISSHTSVVGLAASNAAVMSSENSVASKKYSTKNDRETMNVDSGVSKEVSSHNHRFSEMLQWLFNVAKNPTDPVIGEIPKPSKWASYGNDKIWKQALLARKLLYSRKNRADSPYRFACQKKLRIHPSTFDHFENLHQMDANRSRPRQRLEARLDMKPTASIYTCRPQQRIPIGKEFQVNVPEWTGATTDSDPKWLGTQTWPLKKTEKTPSLIERDPIGRGRRDSCGCQFPSSTDCVKFHVSEKRMKIRIELGSAFYSWNFDKMGEECGFAWTMQEEKKFQSVVKENPQSLQKCFWEPMCEAFPKKKWADHVNYYFNVFMLQRRGYQNRHCPPTDIDSGDDETDYQPTNNSFKT